MEVNTGIGLINTRIGEVLKAVAQIPFKLFTETDTGADVATELEFRGHVLVVDSGLGQQVRTNASFDVGLVNAGGITLEA